jgi:NAD-dependent dihydropyrimidine dehydrogenase PreA subunit
VTYVIAAVHRHSVQVGVDECPLHGIYEGIRALKIHPDECVDCGANGPLCTVGALYCEDDVPGRWSTITADNTAFFAELLLDSGRVLASRGGAAKADALGVVPAPVALHQRRDA